MNELAKSMLSFSWAMSLFGVRQMANVVAPGRAARAFDELTRATERELGPSLRGAFRATDSVQRNLVDLTLGPLTGGWAGGGGQRGAAPRGHRSGGHYAGGHHHGGGHHAGAPAGVPGAGHGGAAFPVEHDISPDFPYAPHYVEVHGSRMHYVTQGEGQPILLLHGNPTWSYLWRNVIPHLSPHGRVIAPDLIGFGLSDKPDVDYTVFDHARYVRGFIDALGLDDVILVLHDQGSAQGFNWAMRNPERVRAIAFFESIVRPFPWDQFSTPDFRDLFRAFRTGGVGGQGWQMIVDQNMFIDQLLPQAAGRPLSDQEMAFYRQPFLDPTSRLPIWVFPRQTPIGGEPRDVWEWAGEYSAWLQRTTIPKLMLYATPGALLTPENVEWCKANVRHLEWVDLGPGSHFLQESSPRRIGREIAGWIERLRSSGRMGGRGAGSPAAPSPGPAAADGGIADLRAQVNRMLAARDQTAPISAIVLFQVDPGREAEFRRNADELIRDTRRLPGCNVFAIEPAVWPPPSGGAIEYLIYEDWETTDLFQVQWDSPHLQRFQASVGDLLTAPPDLRFYDGWREYRGGATR